MDTTGLLLLIVGVVVGACGAALGARGRLAGTAAERDALRAERDRLVAESGRLQAEVREAEGEIAGMRVALDSERASAAEKMALVRAEQERLGQEFQRLSAVALQANNEQFLRLAGERLTLAEQRQAAELEQRKQAVEHLVKPISESLAQVREELTKAEQARAVSHAELREQVGAMNRASEQLRTETAQLVTALRAPQVRGRWGELQLRRVVEAAGMVEHCDFVEQESVSTDDGLLRPDLVVRLAGGKNVVVDAKVAFSGYLEAMEARDDATRAGRLKAHARHLRDHIEDLAAKAYWERFDPSPEFVVMFVPAEAFLNAALEEDPALLEHAFARNVVIATPQTLIALLRTVAYTWRQEALAANAQQVYTLGRELHGRLATMGGHLARLGSELTGAVKAYNATVSSLESRVLVTARRLTDLRVTDVELTTPPQVETATRQVQAVELVAAADEIEVDHRYGVRPEAEPTSRRRDVAGA
jgi:DNA recombination protein RmuC